MNDHPVGGLLHAKLDPLIEIGRAAASQNINRVYTADWREYLRWRARQGRKCVGLYLAVMASGRRGARTVAAIERRSLGAHVEFRPECPALRPQGPPCRDCPRRRPAHHGLVPVQNEA